MDDRQCLPWLAIQNHISSVEIMSLFDSVCRAFCAGIAMRFRVVYRCLDPTLPRMAEHIISRLCFSYNFHGDALPGFNSHIAGLSNYSNRYLTVGIYDKVKEEAAYAGVFLPTCEREQQLAEEALRAMRLAKQWDEKKKRAEELRQEVRASEKKLHDAEDRHRLALQRFEEALPRLQAKVEKKLDAIEKAKQIHAMLDVYSTALAKIRAIEQVQRRSSEKSEEL
ncbi:hypothetical protein H2203_005580 [Taxawa tesnikishii (nom. ined.)]|nr:hypothetical protein H2203_005580 [Dothideales sp. JES 119]